MRIEEVPSVLSWSRSQEIMTALHAVYVERLLKHLGLAIARISGADRSRGERALAALHSLPDNALNRILTAPETSYRLLWPSHHSPERVAEFLEQAVQAELARLDGTTRPGAEVWTALGDMRFSPDGHRSAAAPIDGMLPIDFESPFALAVESEARDGRARGREGFTAAERQLVSDRLRAAWLGLGKSSRAVSNFVRGFTKVLVVQKEPPYTGFSSNSRDDRIGRSAVRNPHLAAVVEVDLADSLVHEAIHSLLYMQEHRHRWFQDEALYSPQERVRSPWSGNRLPLRYFFHACFVWYGLLHFWCVALSRGAFRDPARVKAALVRAARGFVGPRITERVAQWRQDIDPALLQTIDQIQEHVIASLGSGAEQGAFRSA